MLSKIYYGLGVGAISIYLLGNLLSLRSGGTPQPRSFSAMRMEKGKYVYVPPSSYPSGTRSGSTSGGSSSRSSSYPSSGGSSGGK